MNKRKLRRILRESIRSILKESRWLPEDPFTVKGPTLETGPDGSDWVSLQSKECARFRTASGGTLYLFKSGYDTREWNIQCDDENPPVYETFDRIADACPILEKLGCTFEKFTEIPF